MNLANIPSAALTSGTRALSTAATRRPSVSADVTSRLHKAIAWLHPTHHIPAISSAPATTALFSTSGTSQRSSSKEEDDLYQALTLSFRTRLAEQIHKPEDGYKAVIEHWTAHTQKDAMTRQRTRARKERLAAAVQHKDIIWIQKEQERLELEANGSSDDHFYIIQAWIKCGELKRATLAFEHMESLRVSPTVRTLAAMTRAHSRSGGNLAIAGAMVQKMSNLNLHPKSIYDLSALLEYYIKTTPSTHTTDSTSANGGGSMSKKPDYGNERVHDIWRAIEPQLQVSTSPAVNSNASFSYRTYLNFLVSRAHDLESAVELIDRMSTRNISPELDRYPKTALSLVQRLSNNGYFTEIHKLMDQKEAALGKVFPTAAWSDLMEACIARGQHQTARWFYNDMVRYGVQPDIKAKKMFADLQVMGGTIDKVGPVVTRAAGIQETGSTKGSGKGGPNDGTKPEETGIFSILFNRNPKPALS
ncbi:hypothetical protein BGZ96_000299 [Linnemannia gamsii]|uniref:Pentacotripeptide-repeat region of PRORP domain-containing protein n=1 Tax=Linnemannia gamsii TaxID=64522 RepID=A0ABQ7JPN4_9FUNG|nr:hypothetical protein BGZ96_000299 [Linnemannia gamsii]